MYGEWPTCARLEALQKLSAHASKVIRNGQMIVVPSRDLVPGDIVVLDDWYTSSDGYIWGRYVGSTSGKYRYVAVGLDTGKVEPNDYLIKL